MKQELHLMLSETDLKDVTLLVVANKRDLPNAMSVNQLTQILELNKLKNRK